MSSFTAAFAPIPAPAPSASPPPPPRLPQNYSNNTLTSKLSHNAMLSALASSTNVTSAVTYDPKHDNGRLAEVAKRLALQSLDPYNDDPQDNKQTVALRRDGENSDCDDWFLESLPTSPNSGRSRSNSNQFFDHLFKTSPTATTSTPSTSRPLPPPSPQMPLSAATSSSGSIPSLPLSPPILSHKFSGVSIWLELEPTSKFTTSIASTIESIASSASEPTFDPHATVLYNIDPHFLKNGDPQFLQKKLTEVVARLPTNEIILTPKKVVFFPYPRSADNGNGFGALMPFVLMKLSQPLVHLFEICKKLFPPDERHSGLPNSRSIRRCLSDSNLAANEELTKIPERTADVVHKKLSPSSKSHSFHTLDGGPAYTPHVSLAYLDIQRTDVMNAKVCEELEGSDGGGLMKTVRVKSVAAWWTEGGVGDWRRITGVDL